MLSKYLTELIILNSDTHSNVNCRDIDFILYV